MPDPLIYAASTDRDLEQILALQRRNVEEALSPAEVAADGFVTVHHDLELLTAMHRRTPHVVARSGGAVVGYALVMQRDFEAGIPILGPMYEQLRRVEYDGRPVNDYHYFIMGQVCVAKELRGSGAFAGMYHKMRELYSATYDMTITEVARRNARSVRAHEKVGFRLLHRYAHSADEEWDVIGWDWRGA